jgi:hypothetical protein
VEVGNCSPHFAQRRGIVTTGGQTCASSTGGQTCGGVMSMPQLSQYVRGSNAPHWLHFGTSSAGQT